MSTIPRPSKALNENTDGQEPQQPAYPKTVKELKSRWLTDLSKNDSFEYEANVFALCLLMPKPQVLQFVDDFTWKNKMMGGAAFPMKTLPIHMADYFQVEEGHAYARLLIMGIIV